MEMDERIDRIVEDAIASYRRTFATAMACTDDLSPIERLMCASFLVHGLRSSFPPVLVDLSYGRSISDCLKEARELSCRVVVTPQVKVGPYRADFMIVGSSSAGSTFAAVVECDGHDFHEKTKAQAAHDKKRDRYFVQQDIRLLRYTGSEIWRDPMKCADEAIGFVAGKVREWEFTRVAKDEIRREAGRKGAKPWRKVMDE